MKLIKEVRQISHRFSAEELADLSQKNAQLNIEIEEKKMEGKNFASEFSNKVKTLEAKRNELSQKIISRLELRDIFCYARKNFNLSVIEYISMDGEIIGVDAFRPSDYLKQMELKEEVAQNKLAKLAYHGAKYFYEEFRKINMGVLDKDLNDEIIEEVLEVNRTKFITKCITELVESKVLEIDDDIEFDAMYEVVSDWYDAFKVKYYEEPKEIDFKIEEEEKEDNEDLNNGKVEEEKKVKKVKKTKDIKEGPEPQSELPDWLQE